MRISDWSSDVCSSDLHLHHFYTNYFVHCNPADMTSIPISRTVGATQVVDEALLSFTHDVEIPWMLPGIPPTGKRIEVALISVVKFRGDKLWHEHIYWDQATVLAQLGLIDQSTLPVVGAEGRSEEHTSELQSLMRISYAVFCLKKKNKHQKTTA